MIAWTLFSLIYYGIPGPNTALAKVSTGLDAGTYAMQAVFYVLNTLGTDGATIALLAAGCITGFLRSSLRWKALSAGLVLWIIYLFTVGADYMAGRFFSVPCLFSAIICACALRDHPLRPLGSIAAGIMIAALPHLGDTLFSPVDYSDRRILPPFGIANERGFYYQVTGLRSVLRNGGNKHKWLDAGNKLKDEGQNIYIGYVVGMTPYSGGPSLRWVDVLALTDAFLARLPARSGTRVGHYERAFPPGYLDSVLTGQNRIADQALARLYGDVLLASTGDIFRLDRFAAIFRLNTGFHKNAAANFDREAIGLPGIPVRTRQRISCYGLPNPAIAYRLDGPHSVTPFRY
jgi:arabinofuranosyltransferase